MINESPLKSFIRASSSNMAHVFLGLAVDWPCRGTDMADNDVVWGFSHRFVFRII